MQLLASRFGKVSAVVGRIVQKLKELPKLIGGSTVLTTFATTVKNGVAALEAVNQVRYLHNTELVREIIDKINY